MAGDEPIVSGMAGRYATALFELALEQAGRDVTSARLPGHSHISITYSINTDDTELADAMLAFIEKNR